MPSPIVVDGATESRRVTESDGVEGIVVACEADAEALGGGDGGGCVKSDEIVTLAGDFDGGEIGSAPAGVALVHAAPGALTGEDLAEPTGVGEEREPVIAGEEERVVGDHGSAVALRATGEAHRAGVMVGGKAVVVFDPVTQRGRRCVGRGPGGRSGCGKRCGRERSGSGEKGAAGEVVFGV